jgi:hypothetical protein
MRENDVDVPWGKTAPLTARSLKPTSMTSDNYAVFRECLSNAIVARSEGKSRTSKRKSKGKRNARKDVTEDISTERANPEELAEFVDVSTPQTTNPFAKPINLTLTPSSSPQKPSPPSRKPSKTSPTPQPNTTQP